MGRGFHSEAGIQAWSVISNSEFWAKSGGATGAPKIVGISVTTNRHGRNGAIRGQEEIVKEVKFTRGNGGPTIRKPTPRLFVTFVGRGPLDCPVIVAHRVENEVTCR